MKQPIQTDVNEISKEVWEAVCMMKSGKARRFGPDEIPTEA